GAGGRHHRDDLGAGLELRLPHRLLDRRPLLCREERTDRAAACLRHFLLLFLRAAAALLPRPGRASPRGVAASERPASRGSAPGEGTSAGGRRAAPSAVRVAA